MWWAWDCWVLGPGSLEVLDVGLLAVSFLVIFSAALAIAYQELIGAGSSEAPDIVLLAALASVVEAVSAIAAVLALFDPLIYLVARTGLSIDLYTTFAVLAVRSLQEA